MEETTIFSYSQIEQATIKIYAAVTDTEDLGSRQRMNAITEIYMMMTAGECVSTDVLDPRIVTLIHHFLK